MLQDKLEFNIIEFTNEFVINYIDERNKHFNKWSGFINGWGRITNNEETFTKLRNLDFKLSKSYYDKLSSFNLNKEQLIEMLLLINNHSSILQFRILFISLVFTIITPSYAYFIKNPMSKNGVVMQSFLLFFIFIIFAFSLISERWNIKQRSSIYREIENIIKTQIEKLS